jgi:GNAT superfamily N-acetyltransferase
MTIKVRPIEPSDKTPWLGLFDQYIAFYEASVPADVIEATWHRLVTRTDGMMGFSGVDTQGEIAGIAAVVFHRSTWSATVYCYLEDLFVAPAWRGRGVGRALIEAVYEEADRRGASSTYWATAATNAQARLLYDQVASLSPFVQYRR